MVRAKKILGHEGRCELLARGKIYVDFYWLHELKGEF